MTDGRQLADVELKEWNGEQWTPDWSNDFYDNPDGYDCELDAIIVRDVNYCIEQAEDWKNRRGDFIDEMLYTPEEEQCERKVDVDILLSEDSAELTAFRIRHSGEWNPDDIKHLCDLADMAEMYNLALADGENVESVVEAAAEKLGVKIYEEV